MARRKKRIEHSNPDRWLISYADFITLLFAVFVVLYAISSVNEAKYKIFSDSLSIAFTNQPSTSSTTIIPNKQEQLLKTLVDRRTARLGEQQRKMQERMKAVADGLSQVMATMIGQGLVSVNQTKRGIVIDISASSLFKPGEAVLQPAAAEVLNRVAIVLSREDQPIEVEGHTDDVPISTPLFPSNWELSSARASSVVRMLIDHGVPPQRLSAVGMASNQPVVANDSPEHRAKNRRVSITILTPDTEHIILPATP
ncbi:MAG: flagellar motor protein MotD [Gallionella sp.]|jgi:chemotaxis protein MotB|nr:flagellar motor protein MotD [Gallionella sp.]